jgi:hypothetical protein
VKTKSKIIISVIVVIALIAGGFTYLNYSNSNTGKVSVYVEDAPIFNVSAVYITFTNVSLHNTSSGWHTYTLTTTTVNILGLTTTNASLLSSFSIKAGNYTMIRLYITSVNVKIAGLNVSFTLASPDAFINHPFSVSAHSTTGLDIEFNLSQDLNINSRMFTPSIGVVVS